MGMKIMEDNLTDRIDAIDRESVMTSSLSERDLKNDFC